MFLGSKLVHVVNMWDFLLREGGEGWASKIWDQPLFFRRNMLGLNFLVKNVILDSWFSTELVSQSNKRILSETCWGERIHKWGEKKISSQQKLEFFPPTLGTRILGRNSIASIKTRWNIASQEIWRLIPNPWHFVGWSCHEPCWVKSVTFVSCWDK